MAIASAGKRHSCALRKAIIYVIMVRGKLELTGLNPNFWTEALKLELSPCKTRSANRASFVLHGKEGVSQKVITDDRFLPWSSALRLAGASVGRSG